MIEISNLTTRVIDENFLKQIAQQVLNEEKKEGSISIALVGAGRMRKLNKKYRKKNKITDVLVFSGKKLPSEPYSQELQKLQGLGEVVICLSELKKSARRFEVSFEKELARVLVHGILHLLGYDHEKTEEEREKMREKEEKYVKLLNC